MKLLEIFSEIVNWSVLIYILSNVVNTACFERFDWILVSASLIFSYFVRYVSKIEDTKSNP